jgi:hypothetical protein
MGERKKNEKCVNVLQMHSLGKQRGSADSKRLEDKNKKRDDRFLSSQGGEISRKSPLFLFIL